MTACRSPLEDPNDKNYFSHNLRALERIRKNHQNLNEQNDFTIHRIFVVSEENIKNSNKAQEIRSRIQEHCDADLTSK